MMTIEVQVRKGTLTAQRREELGRRLLGSVAGDPGDGKAPESVLATARALTNVLVREEETWVTQGDEPRYLVRLTVPGSWQSKEFTEYMIAAVTEAVAATEDDPGRLYREPHCQVQVVGLKEHAVGTLGRVTTATDITRLITDGYRASADQREPAPGTAIDPVCGMTVDLATATITLEHDGTLYAFCAPVCKKVFSEDRAGGARRGSGGA
ncbi:YHS domain-containing protein [Actinophytocola algeriensis]|uniref:YHS domain-containing protein n=1 Tax=Actinophytocola algeriensis TaxID=1768010 RepID=A0A7W7QB93_9PSEU|nr:YHS domain-containing protein [Actinophytocola algeriensis]MBB4910476.1 YHS domain-containing protein [Actinophytocola algeriensis]MBE1480535.1 YHS domain-containing protein [Actinophytocola algeriensis]